MTTVAVLLLLYSVAITALWRLSAASCRKLMGRWIRANDQFMACDVELNKLKVAHGQVLMRLQDAKK